MNSPLLNDNDIRGAKWILININSAEGEHEFTMDEVEIIQNHLLSQAGEDTDVILGLGYDSNLGSKIGITLIATGFEHKDPFGKKREPKPEKKQDEKIVMTLDAEEDKKRYTQPVFVFDEKREELNPGKDVKNEETELKKVNAVNAVQERVSFIMEDEQKDKMTPSIVEIPEPVKVNLQPANETITVDKSSESIIHFALSSEPDPITAEQNQTQSERFETTSELITNKEINRASTAQTSGGYLAKPSQIYAEAGLKQESKIAEEPKPLYISKQEDEPVIEMKLVVKSHEAAEGEKEPKVHQTMPIMIPSVEELPQVDKAEDDKRRAMERLAKLRNLSFNVNATDPNNEFESVPAYLRRNMEHNSIADVETFYSNYVVKPNENNKAEISTINTFLDGKKPD